MINLEDFQGELKLLISDRYTAVEIVDRLDLSTDDILDNFYEEVYNKLYRFDELCADIGLEFNGDEHETNLYETGHEEET